MKLLTLYTEKYEKKLSVFLEYAPIVVRGNGFCDPLYFFRCAYAAKETRFTDALANFLEDIVLYENPIYRNSVKLRHAAHRMRRTNSATREHLRQYLRQHKALHIEGYTAFRMEGYKHKLDLMMVGLIRKLKLT
jgi:hypothetical protein